MNLCAYLSILKRNKFFGPTPMGLISTFCSQHVLPSYCSVEDHPKGVTVICVLKMNAKRHFLVDPPSSQVHSN